MKRQDIERNPVAGAGPSSEEYPRATVLAVGDVREWTRHRGSLPVDGNLAFTSFEGITAELFDILTPELVLSPLLARGFDCIDLAQLLSSINFLGRYRAVTDEIPNPDMVRREIRSLCPKLDFDIVMIPVKGLRIN